MNVKEIAIKFEKSEAEIIQELRLRNLIVIDVDEEVPDDVVKLLEDFYTFIKKVNSNITATREEREAEEAAIARENEELRQERISEILKDLYFGDASLDDSLSKSKITSQSEVLARLLNRESLFISGPAGSGKSSVVSKFVELLELESEGNIRIAMTASTGMAASLIEGQTIHSWAGLGVSSEPFDPKDVPAGMWVARDRMAEVDVLVIDEVSMIPLYLFEKLDKVLQWAKRNKKPFGGVQLVLMGDFLQLPPVNRDPDVDARFAVFSESWKALELKYCYLDRIHRAKDKALLYVLNSIAANKVNEKTLALLDSRLVDPEEGRDYTKLYTTNRNVDRENSEMLAKNPNPGRIYRAGFRGNDKDAPKLFRKYGIDRQIELKKGAVVMLTKNTSNIKGFYPNGSVGKVVSFQPSNVSVRFSDGNVVDVGYHTIAEEKKEFIEIKQDDGSVIKKTIMVPVAEIKYLPLKLGYAITVHKAQGTTIDSVQADLSNCFTPGLGYVALSRARTLDDLVLLGYDEKALKVSPTSSKVTRIVRTKAKKDRISFEEEKDFYDGLLSQPLLRKLKWNF